MTSRLRAVAAAIAAFAGMAHAQDATRGATLYRMLPGDPGVGSCFSCHGEPVNNRNSVLRGAAGASLISRTIGAVGAMGYLRQYLVDADLADIAAYLGTIVPAGPLDALPDLSPASDGFGAQLVGTQSVEREILVRNRQARGDIGIGAITSSDLVQFPLRHDCPLALPPLGECRIRIAFRPSAAGAAAASFSIVDSGGLRLRSGAVAGTGSRDTPATLGWSAPPALAFGVVTIGESVQRSALLVNASTVPAQLARLRVSGPNASRFGLESDCPAGSRIEAGASCEVRVRYAPAVPGLVEGWIEIESDAANAPIARISATGIAAAAPAPAPETTTPPGGGAVRGLWLAALAAALVALRQAR